MIASASLKSNVEVDDVEGVVFNEFAALFYVFAHERLENIFGGYGVFEAHLEERARFGVHRGFPELLGIHFAEALEARDGELLFGVFEDVIQKRLRAFLDRKSVV